MLNGQDNRRPRLLGLSLALLFLGAFGALVGIYLTQQPAAPVARHSEVVLGATDGQPDLAPVLGTRQSVPRKEVSEFAEPNAADMAPLPKSEVEGRMGAVTGTLCNHLGEILVGHRVLLVRGRDLMGDRSRSALTDHDGHYFVDRMPVGTWSVFYAGPRSTGHGAAVHLGDVEVHAEQLTQFHLVLVGERELVGTYRIRDEAGIGLELELRRVADGRLVGLGWAVDLQRPARRPPPVPTDDGVADPDRDSTRDGPGSGAFAFRGLAPEPHVLRVVLGADEQGRPMAVEHVVDLSEHDVTLEERPTLEQFFRLALDRR